MNHARHRVRTSMLGAGLGARLLVAGAAMGALWATVLWALS